MTIFLICYYFLHMFYAGKTLLTKLSPLYLVKLAVIL